jgi:oxygen-independent coproporphyrinogen-3 oxidase
MYWTRRPVEALGPGAHAFDGSTRRWNAARLDGYLAALLPADDGQGGGPTLPPGGAEPPATPDEATAEALILGLRLDDGVPLADLLDDRFAVAFVWASDLGLLEPAADGDRARLTTQGRLLSNELFSRLL